MSELDGGLELGIVGREEEIALHLGREIYPKAHREKSSGHDGQRPPMGFFVSPCATEHQHARTVEGGGDLVMGPERE